ncbi:MAG: SGNH hydrolase domain-containing protein [Chloroflexota bacterium]
MRRTTSPIGPAGSRSVAAPRRARPSRARRPILALATVALLAASVAGPATAAGGGGTIAPRFTPVSRVDTDGDGLTDAWERRWGLDPTRPDTNHDGLIDSVEDPDHDNLSDLGEQRFKTNPHRADSNGNGVTDGNEDTDGDGIDNRHQQDRRAIPAGLKPTLANAFQDKPAPYGDDCLNGGDQAQLNPCVYGDAKGTKTIVLFGDSHAAQWVPAFARAGSKAHWRIVLLGKSSCPAADITWDDASVFPTCEPWRADAFAWLTLNPPDLVVLASARVYTMYDTNRKPLGASAARAAWAAAFTRTIQAMPASSRVMVLADTLRPRVDVPACLAANPRNMAPCLTPLRVGIDKLWLRAERQATRAAGASYVGLTRYVCPYDPCPVVNGPILMWRDDSHLTATFSRMLGPSVMAVLRQELASG